MAYPAPLAAAALILLAAAAGCTDGDTQYPSLPAPPDGTAQADQPPADPGPDGQAPGRPDPTTPPSDPDPAGASATDLPSGADAVAAAQATSEIVFDPDIAVEGSPLALERCGPLPSSTGAIGDWVAVLTDPDWTDGRSCVLRQVEGALGHPSVTVHEHPAGTSDPPGRTLPPPSGCPQPCPTFIAVDDRTVAAVAADGMFVTGHLVDPDGTVAAEARQVAGTDGPTRMLVDLTAAVAGHWRHTGRP